MFTLRSAATAAAVLTALTFTIASADEGTWTFDNSPIRPLEEKYGFTPTQEWLDHVRLASVRIGDGGSGSFVRPEGLVLTSHHVARGQLQKLSSPEVDYVRQGFFARTRAEESMSHSIWLYNRTLCE